MASAHDGFTLIELLLVVAIIGTVASIAVPGLFRARMSANEASAIGTSRTVVEGQSVFSSVCGNGFYAESLAQLATDQYVSPDLASGVKSGYNISLTFSGTSLAGPADCHGVVTTTEYHWTATPRPNGGTRSFAANEIGTIWQDLTGAPILDPIGSGPETPIQ